MTKASECRGGTETGHRESKLPQKDSVEESAAGIGEPTEIADS
jgi:hypothetical protein